MTLAAWADISTAMRRTLPFAKAGSTPALAVGPMSQWTQGTVPAAAATPPTGVGEAPTAATAGAMPIWTPGGGHGLYLKRIQASIKTSTNGTLLTLYDRLVHTSGLDGTLLTAQTVNSAAITRADAAANAIAFLEIYTAIGGSTQTATVSYTNQSGVAGRTATAVVGSGNSTKAIGAMVPLLLQAGDTAVQSVQSVTLGGSTGTVGNFGVTIARPIASLSGAPATGFAVEAREFDVGAAPITSGACLFFAAWSWDVFAGELEVIEV